MPITVASYNMRKAIGADRRRRPDCTLDVLAEIDADVVALQEADRRFGGRASAIPPEMLAKRGHYKAVPFDVRPGSMGWHGNAILVRQDVEILDFAALTLPTLEPRGAVLAELRLEGVELRVVGMHLDLSGLWRRRQARALIAQLAERPAMATVIMGDLNEWRPEHGCLRDFARAPYRIAPSGPTFHAKRPIARLDRIIVNEALEVVDSGAHHSRKAATASDHLPVWAKLNFPRPLAGEGDSPAGERGEGNR